MPVCASFYVSRAPFSIIRFTFHDSRWPCIKIQLTCRFCVSLAFIEQKWSYPSGVVAKKKKKKKKKIKHNAFRYLEYCSFQVEHFSSLLYTILFIYHRGVFMTQQELARIERRSGNCILYESRKKSLTGILQFEISCFFCPNLKFPTHFYKSALLSNTKKIKPYVYI